MMTNIRCEMVYYRVVKQWVVMVLYNDADGESAALYWYPKTRREAIKQLALVQKQYLA